MSLYLVRHAKAGSRSNWDADDRDRPLSNSGRRQAAALAERLATCGPSTLLSSPYVRCRQTLEPLASVTGLPVIDDERLAEGGTFEAVLDLLSGLPDGAVLCSHGDIIPDTIGALERRGCAFTTPADWRKASVWVLERHGSAITEATVWPPPE